MKWITSLLFVAVLCGTTVPVQSQESHDAAATWNTIVEKGIAYLRKAQSNDGSFSGDRHIGITGLVLTGIMKTGKVSADDPMVAKALGYIEKLINKESGNLAGSNPRQMQKNYVTAVNVMALAAANKNGKYDDVIKSAAKYLIGLQWDEGEGATNADPYYGGFGYDEKTRPDLSNTGFALEALQAAGVPRSDPAYKRAATFISRCQNLKGEHQDQPWAGSVNDGSFIYVIPDPKRDAANKKGAPPATPGPGYASVTYAGIKSMIYAGVDKNDQRVQQALSWIKKNYSVESNLGQPKGREKSGLFYFYHTMSKSLDVVGMDTIEDAQGAKHDWRKELTLQLAKVQRPDGSWANEMDRFMEGDPNLVTGFALMALSYSKPK